MTSLADMGFGRILGPALIVVLVPIALGFFCRAAATGSRNHSAQRVVEYPIAFKGFVWGAWFFLIAISIIAVFSERSANSWTGVFSLLFFAALILSLHLEAYFVKITWDDQTIYTRSPWRRSRAIPISSVQRCDFSQLMQWYCIHTSSQGIVRLHMFARGIPQLLEALPVSHPGYPPR